MKKSVFLGLFLMMAFIVGAQESTNLSDSVESRIQQQLTLFPQEKIYLQTDKSSYLSGERIWFRAHLVDALTHKPAFISRYVYVEILSPMDDLVKRVKIRPDSTGAYSGYVDLNDDLAEGAYTMRAYTNYMRNMGEDSFFRKPIHILDPFSLQIEPLVSFRFDKTNIDLSMYFIDRKTNDTITPKFVSCKLAQNASKTLTPKKNRVYNWNISLSEKETNRTMLLGLIHNGRKYNRYYAIPYNQADFDVSFFPEGGYLVPGATCQVAFKSLNAGGMGENVSGALYDSKDNEILAFESLHLGMGLFHFTPSQGESYHAICKNELGISKRFNLPAPEPKANVIATRIAGNRLMINNNKGSEAEAGAFSLLIHHKGLVLYHKAWDPSTDLYVFPIKSFPEGILNIMLLNDKLDIVSERLIFNTNVSDKASVHSTLNKSTFKPRENITMALKLFDSDSIPISGNIAVSVTDKESVIQDSTTHIMSTLLLTSELKGYVESPASYFKNGNVYKFALDALMMTQGWRRYNLPDVLHGKIQKPNTYEPELAQKITGKADGIFSSLKEGQISLMASLDSLVNTEVIAADDEGRFTFNVEYPEGTSILIQSKSKKGGKFNAINIDKETFPEIQGAGILTCPDAVNHTLTFQDSYMLKADEEYTQLNGLRTVMLDEVTISAQSKQKYKESSFYSPIHSSGAYTAEDIEKMKVSSLRSLLYRTPGIIIRNDKVTTTRSTMPVLFIIDNMKYEDFSDRLDDIDITAIEGIFVLKDNVSMPGYYPNTNGAIVITTRMGYKMKPRNPPNLDNLIPLGYQQAAEFYSPRYETPEQKQSPNSDLRTTIYWKSNVQISKQGETVIDFYSADTPTTYQVIGEGVSDNGKLIQFSEDIIVK